MPQVQPLKKKKKNLFFGVPLCRSGLRIQCCHFSGLGHCCGTGSIRGTSSIPGPGTFTCHGCGWRKFIFLEHFKLHNKIIGKVQRFLLYFLHPHTQSLRYYQHPHQSVQLLQFMKLLHSPRSTVYIRAQSWCCTFYGFRQTYNNVNLPF